LFLSLAGQRMGTLGAGTVVQKGKENENTTEGAHCLNPHEGGGRGGMGGQR